MIETKRAFFKNIVFSIIIVDLLIAPYVQLIIIPWGILIMAFILPAIGFRIIKDGDLACIFIVIICSFFSTLTSLLRPFADIVAVDNIKYLLQLISTFLYFYAFRWYGNQNWCDLKFVLLPIYIFCAWYLFLIIYYVITPFEAIEFIKKLYGRTTVQLSDFETDLRFPYLFSDPNTAIYFCLMSLAFLYYLKPDLVHLKLLFFIGSIAVFVSQSTGGMVAFLVILTWSYLALFRIHEFKRRLIFFTFLGLTVLIYIVILINASEVDSLLIKAALDRFSDGDRYESGGGRIHHWINLFSMYPLPFGRGYLLYDDGIIKPPHSDLFGTVYRYGFIATVFLIVFLFFKKNRITIFAIPAIVPFLINAFIEDQKLFGLYLVFLGVSISLRCRL